MEWDSILSAPVNEPMATTFDVCPEGDFTMTIDDGELSIRTVKLDRGDVPVLELSCVVLDDNVKAALGRDKVTARLSIWLDLENGKLSTGSNKNVLLGQLREALGQNAETGWTFNRLPGAGPFRGHVTQTSSKNNPEQKFANVMRVTRI